MEQILQTAPTRQAYFWSTHSGAELDLLLFLNGKRVGIEFKASTTPGMTKSLHIARADLKLDHAFIVHAGEHRFPLAPGVEAISLPEILTLLPTL